MQQKGSQVGRGETKRKEKKPELEDVGLGEMLERVFLVVMKYGIAGGYVCP